MSTVHPPSGAALGVPLVSVVIPAYNAERTIGASIAGALDQTHPRVEVVVVDDGSTDRTRAICEAYGDLITVASLENGGTSRARNAAIDLARGDFVALCDADDVLLPPHIEAALDAWRAAGGGRRFVHAEALFLTAGGIGHGYTVFPVPTPAPSRQRRAILEANFVSIFALLPTAMIRELGGFRDRYLEDWDLWIRAIHAGWVAVPQPTPHALYRTGGASKSADRDAVLRAEDELLRDVGSDPDARLRPAERAYLRRRLAATSPQALLAAGEAALRRGDERQARRAFGEASRLWPSNRRLRLKAATLRVPGLARVWQRRLAGIDAGLRRATPDQSATG